MTDAGSAPQSDHDSSVIGTAQSLIVAFVLAMTFRGFVVEGFVIPTGSMAPTLLGQHKRLDAEQTGWNFPVGYDVRMEDPRYGGANLGAIADPMLGPQFPGSGTDTRHAGTRLGDRILVVKTLYPFFQPDRFDVVVFKNPTHPTGGNGNYIKRLIGLAGESIWLTDGDVFAGSAQHPHDYAAYRVQRKPEYIQRAVWQPIHDSDYLPTDPDALPVQTAYPGVPWQGDDWQTNGRRAYRCDTAELSELRWNNDIRALDDWTPYNELLRMKRTQRRFPVSDIRVAAAVVPDQPGLAMTFQIEARGHLFQYLIGNGSAQVRMRPADDENAPWTGCPAANTPPLNPGTPANLEFWHVDQSMAIYLDGKRVAYHEYDWDPVRRLHLATGRDDDPAALSTWQALNRFVQQPRLHWRFNGSPLTLHRVRLDRDLFYRPDDLLQSDPRNPTNPGFEELVRTGAPAFGTHPDNLAVLGPDQFFMLGDNSAASSDSRLWGNPHPLVASQIDPAPFVVDRRLLLGKAWGVYFPSPLPLTDQGRSVIPDFGRCRFIR